MDPAATLRERALKLLESDAPDAVSQAAELLKTASDIEQQQANISKLEADRKKVEQDLRESRNRWKEILTAFGPLFTTAVLAGTLIFQIYQAQQTNKEALIADEQKRAETMRQAQETEQTRFTEALKIIQSSENISPAATLLNTFTQEPQKSEARKMAMKLLLRAQSIGEFEDLFSSVLDPIIAADLPTLVQLNRSVTSRYSPLVLEAHNTGYKEDTSKMDHATRALYDLLASELYFLSQKMALLLQGPRQNGLELDLSYVTIDQVDMKGADLSSANLRSSSFAWVNLDGCDLSRITNFQSDMFISTAWWHAAHISRPLLAYLEASAPYRESFKYPNEIRVGAEEYETNLARLKASALP
jgi:Pentapeptide repeats (8 copies)